jgi:hypothetical protein
MPARPRSSARLRASRWRILPTASLSTERDISASLDQELRSLFEQSPEEFTRRSLRQIPVGRIERPEDVAGVMPFLVSPRPEYTTGHARSGVPSSIYSPGANSSSSETIKHCLGGTLSLKKLKSNKRLPQQRRSSSARYPFYTGVRPSGSLLSQTSYNCSTVHD